MTNSIKKSRESFTSLQRYWGFFILSTTAIPGHLWRHPTKKTGSIFSFHIPYFHSSPFFKGRDRTSQKWTTKGGIQKIKKKKGRKRGGMIYEGKGQDPLGHYSFHGCLTECKKLRQSLNSFSRYCTFKKLCNLTG